MFIQRSLSLIIQNIPEQALNKMLTFVTKKLNIRQLLTFTCFIIHVGSLCIGEKAYAWGNTNKYKTVSELYEFCPLVFCTEKSIQGTGCKFNFKPQGNAHNQTKAENGKVQG